MGTTHTPFLSSRGNDGRIKNVGLVALVFLAGFLAALSLQPLHYDFSRASRQTRRLKCHVPLPNLQAHLESPPQSLPLDHAAMFVDKYFSRRSLDSDVDSIAIAVVTTSGTIFEKGYGVLKANETDRDSQGIVDRDSIYRIASITKMFTVLETLVLRERGVLNWDDPVTKFLPHFRYPSRGWAQHVEDENGTYSSTPITLRQLASHMSGLGRDLPYQKIEDWPARLPDNTGDPIPQLSLDLFLKIISEYPLIAEPYTYPIYSNTGFNILGLSNVASNKRAGKDNGPKSHKELLQRDIFDPLALNSSFYRVPYGTDLVQHVAVPAKNHEWADLAFGDSLDPAGGQYSSLADLATLMRTILSPSAEGGVIPSHVVREWLRPLHGWGDGVQEVGAPWEVQKITKTARLYTKGGNMPGYHSIFALNPEYGYGVIVLVTGQYSNTNHFLSNIVQAYQPAFEALQQDLVTSTYAGVWSDGNGSSAKIRLIRGELYLEKLVIDKIDVLERLRSIPDEFGSPSRKQSRLALWGTGRVGEFRIALGRSEINADPESGCEPYWVSIDMVPSSRGYPIDLLYFVDGTFVYPSAAVRLSRASG